jgi:hypothetical protein
LAAFSNAAALFVIGKLTSRSSCSVSCSFTAAGACHARGEDDAIERGPGVVQDVADHC